jgi:hypothetical protein
MKPFRRFFVGGIIVLVLGMLLLVSTGLAFVQDAVSIFLPLVLNKYPEPKATTQTPTGALMSSCPQTGEWFGETNQGHPISLSVSDIPSCWISSLTIKMWLFCSGFPGFRPTTVTIKGITISNNQFSFSGSLPGVYGTFTSPGSVSGTWNYNDMTCHNSGTWTASTSTPTPTPTPTVTSTPTPTPTRINPDDMVLIPAGLFQMGCDESIPDENCSENEIPMHTVTLDSYKIDKYEVTNAQYAMCVAAGSCDPPLLNNSTTRFHTSTIPLTLTTR